MDQLRLYGMKAEKGRWLLILTGMLINLCLGSIYSWSVFVTPLSNYFQVEFGQQISPAAILLPFSIFLACFALAMPPAGRLIETWGPRKTTIFGGFLTGCGWLLASFAPSVTILSIVYGIIGGVGVGITYGVPIAVAARWFPDRRGLAVGCTVLGFGFSAFITAQVADFLISSFGVPATFQIFGVVFLVLITILALPLSFPPTGWHPSGMKKISTTSSSDNNLTRSQMVRTPTFYGLWICYFLGCLAGLMAISIAKPVGIEDAGIAPALATTLVGFFAIFNGGGRPVFGALTDHLNPKNTAMLSFALIGIASLGIWLYPSPVVYIAAFAILWGCLGGWLAIAPAATAQFFGTNDYPRCYGLIFLAYGAGALAGPQMAGYVRNASGSYLGIFPVILVLAIIGFVVASIFLRMPGTKESKINK